MNFITDFKLSMATEDPLFCQENEFVNSLQRHFTVNSFTNDFVADCTSPTLIQGDDNSVYAETWMEEETEVGRVRRDPEDSAPNLDKENSPTSDCHGRRVPLRIEPLIFPVMPAS